MANVLLISNTVWVALDEEERMSAPEEILASSLSNGDKLRPVTDSAPWGRHIKDDGCGFPGNSKAARQPAIS